MPSAADGRHVTGGRDRADHRIELEYEETT